MNILLDECTPRLLKRLLPEFEIATVQIRLDEVSRFRFVNGQNRSTKEHEIFTKEA